jgi:hypothetical protein
LDNINNERYFNHRNCTIAGDAFKPGRFDTWLVNHGGYSGGCGLIWAAPDAITESNCPG